jgi:hypothetical protein
MSGPATLSPGQVSLDAVLSHFSTAPFGIPDTFLLGQDFMSFLTKVPTLLDARRHVLRSEKVYPTGGQTKLTFFDQGIGAATQQEGDTNMQIASMLAGQEIFVALDLRMLALPARADYDTAAAGTPIAFGDWTEVMMRNCWLDFKIGRKKYLDTIGPLAMFSPGFGPVPVAVSLATVTRNIAWPSFGTPDTKSLFLLDPPITIVAGENIEAAALWKTALAVTTAGKLGMYLNGYLIGPAQ